MSPRQQLTATLERLLADHDEGARQYERARDLSAEMHRQWPERLAALKANPRTKQPPITQLEERLNDHQASHARSRQYREGLCDAYACLMRMYADPAERDVANEVAAALRELELIQFEPLSPFPEFEPPTPEELAKPDAKFLIAERWFAQSDERWAETCRRHDDQMRRTRELLQRSLHILTRVPATS